MCWGFETNNVFYSIIRRLWFVTTPPTSPPRSCVHAAAQQVLPADVLWFFCCFFLPGIRSGLVCSYECLKVQKSISSYFNLTSNSPERWRKERAASGQRFFWDLLSTSFTVCGFNIRHYFTAELLFYDLSVVSLQPLQQRPSNYVLNCIWAATHPKYHQKISRTTFVQCVWVFLHRLKKTIN